MMNFLTERLPDSINVDGVEYPIQTDFRTILRYSAQMDTIAEDDFPAIVRCMKIVICDKFPDDIFSAISALNWFIKCGREEEMKRPPNRLLGINSNQPFDFSIDGEMIWSAFRRNDVYGIDLLEIPYLHWWKFVAMLDDLPEDTRLRRIMDYRTIDTTNKNLSKEMRDVYSALQRYYKIRAAKDQRNEELINALKDGRDPTPYL